MRVPARVLSSAPLLVRVARALRVCAVEPGQAVGPREVHALARHEHAASHPKLQANPPTDTMQTAHAQTSANAHEYTHIQALACTHMHSCTHMYTHPHPHTRTRALTPPHARSGRPWPCPRHAHLCFDQGGLGLLVSEGLCAQPALQRTQLRACLGLLVSQLHKTGAGDRQAAYRALRCKYDAGAGARAPMCMPSHLQHGVYRWRTKRGIRPMQREVYGLCKARYTAYT